MTEPQRPIPTDSACAADASSGRDRTPATLRYRAATEPQRQDAGVIRELDSASDVYCGITQSEIPLAASASFVNRIKEEERLRIARELHDELGGHLTATKLALASLCQLLSKNPALAERSANVNLHLDRTIDALCRISVGLRPDMVDFGIVAALQSQAQEFEEHQRIGCQFESNCSTVTLPEKMTIALCRIAQEGLTNISKHAGATKVTIRLNVSTTHIQLEITDNGRGIDRADMHNPQALGIRGMAERVTEMEGTLTVRNAAACGSVVVVQLPLPHLAGGDASVIAQ